MLVLALWVGLYDDVRFPPPTPQVAALVRQLGDDSFQQREAASKKLAGMGDEALKALEMAEYSPDPEIRRRSKNLLRKWYEIKPTSGKDLPSTWALPSEFTLSDGKVVKWGRMDRRHAIRPFVPAEARYDYWANVRAQYEATHGLVRKLARGGMPKKDIVRLLDQMEKSGVQFNGTEYAWMPEDEYALDGSEE